MVKRDSDSVLLLCGCCRKPYVDCHVASDALRGNGPRPPRIQEAVGVVGIFVWIFETSTFNFAR